MGKPFTARFPKQSRLKPNKRQLAGTDKSATDGMAAAERQLFPN